MRKEEFLQTLRRALTGVLEFSAHIHSRKFGLLNDFLIGKPVDGVQKERFQNPQTPAYLTFF